MIVVYIPLVYNLKIMTYNFQETPNTASKVIDTITLTANDYLSFPTFLVEKNKLKKMGPEIYTKLFYDKYKKAIAIQFISEKQAGLYKVNVSPQYGATCKIKAFLLNNEIDTKVYADKYKYKKYKASDLGLEGNEVFVINLENKKAESSEEK